MSVQEYIEKRQAGFLDAFNRCSIEDLDKYFPDEGLDYSDLGASLEPLCSKISLNWNLMSYKPLQKPPPSRFQKKKKKYYQSH